MSNWKEFEGLNSIKDDYKFKVAENLIKNELGGISNGYMLSHAGTGNSGWSFGGHQYDLSVNKDGRELIKDILDKEYGKEFYLEIKENLLKAKDSNSLDKETINKINQALSSDYGKELINKDFIKAVDKVCSHIEKFEDKINVSLTSGEKMMLADYHNQYGLSINSSSSASLVNKITKIVEEKGDITKEDLKSLFQETKYYKGNESQKDRVDNTYNNAIELDKNLNSISNTQGINNLEDLSKELIIRFEDNKEEKLSILEKELDKVNKPEVLEQKLQILKEFSIASIIDNIYSKQLIEQYQNKVIENKGQEVSALDFLNMDITYNSPDLNTQSNNTNQENLNSESKYQSFSLDSSSNQNSNSSVQMIQ